MSNEDPKPKPKRDMDERVKINLDPEVALDALLKVEPTDPEAELVDENDAHA